MPAFVFYTKSRYLMMLPSSKKNPGTPQRHGQLASLFLSLLMLACGVKETARPVVYEGPISEGENILMKHTENQKLKVVLKAKKYFEFQNGDREFPEGIYIEFYDEFGKITSTLRANHAFYFKLDNKWRGRGKVEVVNTEKKEQLNTEELFWLPSTKKILTEKFVTIRTEGEVLFGTGLDATEDLSTYKISKPEGEFEVED